MASEKLSDTEKVQAIEKIVAATDMHRTRSRREALVAIAAVINDDDLPKIEASTPAAVEAAEESDSEGEKPPTAGSGSSAAAWREYAEIHGVDIEEGATKAQIIAAVEAAEESDSEG